MLSEGVFRLFAGRCLCGYEVLYRTGKVQEAACWAHARRKFHAAEATDVARSVAAVAWIRRRSRIETAAKAFSPEARKALTTPTQAVKMPFVGRLRIKEDQAQKGAADQGAILSSLRDKPEPQALLVAYRGNRNLRQGISSNRGGHAPISPSGRLGAISAPHEGPLLFV